MARRIRIQIGGMPLPGPGVLLGLAVGLVALQTRPAPAVLGGPQTGSQTEETARGEHLYRMHCLNCHGPEGRGDGPMARVLKTRPPDLTLLTKRHRGEFPREYVHQSIDGRFRVGSHGLREMPVWGLSFQVRGRDDDQEHEVQTRLRALVSYLESIQRQE
jgi:mono/diheme cytochrome c family protein